MNIPEVPTDCSPNMRRFLMALRDSLLSVTGSGQPPIPPTNLVVTPFAGGNIVDFTRSNGESYTAFWSSTGSLTDATPVPLGNTSRYIDNIGAGAITRYYWVKAIIGNLESAVTGPVIGTSLALGTAIVPPTPPPAQDPYLPPDPNLSGRFGSRTAD